MQNLTRFLTLTPALVPSHLLVHFAEKFSLINYYPHFANLPHTHTLVKSVHRRTSKMATKTFVYFIRVAREAADYSGAAAAAPNLVATGVAYVCQKLIKNSLQIHTQQVALPLPAGSQVGPRYPTGAEQNGCRVSQTNLGARKKEGKIKREFEMSRRLGFKCLPKLYVRHNNSNNNNE